jgi:hypothetical protein
VDAEVVRYNERYKALGTFCDNAGLAVWVGSVAQFFDADRSNFLVVFGVVLGLAFLFGGWHMRGLIQSEAQ